MCVLHRGCHSVDYISRSVATLEGLLGYHQVWVSFFVFFFPVSSLNYPISGHYILWREGVKYGDITISNLTHHNGIGVFNDLDYTTTPHSRKFDRHRLTAFLAVDLIHRDGIIEADRRYRRGLESLFWVLLWISSCYNDNMRTILTYQHRWLSDDIIESGCFRYAILSWAERVPPTKSYWLLLDLSACSGVTRTVISSNKGGTKSSCALSTYNNVLSGVNIIR